MAKNKQRKKEPRVVNYEKGYPDGTEKFDNEWLRNKRRSDESYTKRRRKF